MIPEAEVLSFVERWRQSRSFGFLALLFVGFVIAALLTRSGPVQHMDSRLTGLMQRLQGRSLDRLMRYLTILGDPPALVGLSVLSGILLWITHRPAAGILCVASLLGLPLNIALKELVRRPRPDQSLVKVLLPVTGRSFPSGHAMTSVMLYGFLAHLLWIHLPDVPARSIGMTCLVLIPLGVGLSRVYLGVHWFSDVIGGWAAGVFFLLIMGMLYGVLSRVA